MEGGRNFELVGDGFDDLMERGKRSGWTDEHDEEKKRRKIDERGERS